jgi:hypothetical protein
MSVEAYAAAGRAVEVPRPVCPGCAAPMVFWSGYRRAVRDGRCCVRVWVRRACCGRCGGATHALLPAFCLVGRVDAVERVGQVVEAVAAGRGGVRPAAAAVDVPYTTARGWVRRFAGRAAGLAAGFAALAVELGGPAVRPPAGAAKFAVRALRAAWQAATGLPGWLALGAWRFASMVCGGRLLAANTVWPYLIVGRRRVMPPVP